MRPNKIRAVVALVWAALLLDAAFFTPAAPPLRLATKARAGARIVEPSDRVAKNRPALSPPQASRPAPVAAGEPTDAAQIVRVRGGAAPPKGSFAVAFPAQARAARTTARGGNSWALIVGINDYQGSTRDNIGSYQDATSLRTYLLGLGWQNDHIVLLGNRQATRVRIVQGLQWLAAKADAGSTVVFHYSGHERPYGTDVDGDGEVRDVALWAADNKLIVDGDLGRLLGAVAASKMWLNFAVCRAGGFNDPGTVKPGRLVTYSSPESELSYEDPEVDHSVFGYFSIVEGMRSRHADANGDGVTTVQEAFAYARPRVIDRTSDRQHPAMADAYGRSFSLVPARAASSAPGTEPSPSPSACTVVIGCDFAEHRY